MKQRKITRTLLTDITQQGGCNGEWSCSWLLQTQHIYGNSWWEHTYICKNKWPLSEQKGLLLTKWKKTKTQLLIICM